ncbi:hypothetical protein [Flammeovirga kamogawensis]|uniref:Uncharacterized protein n=1 Tax=Flammeovirga kamogawensis TaxID=373891 RepID=A0ABX8GTP9_9BACT|nr:hypothetical protein [Flammeovirga kamogawensis]MBB6462463.1 hypothetical protein [Flammeovirga kamogawensis]QWG06799.1 hypothetical protein KM029_16035 [Flammeovirga kamogawensis]TRX68622.1 hypothetical protein EO216_11030 [Flammeovirga kamogawensis]
MKLFVRISLIFTNIFLLTNCSQIDKIHDSEQVYYFDLASLIDSAVADLDRKSPSVEKEIDYDGEKDVIDVKDIDWEKELEVFAQADINRPVLKDSYVTVITNKDDGLKVTRYEANGPRELVRWLELSEDKNGKLISVAFKMFTDNSLFSSQKEGRLEFTMNQKLKRYSLAGAETILFLGEKNYAVKGNLVY